MLRTLFLRLEDSVVLLVSVSTDSRLTAHRIVDKKAPKGAFILVDGVSMERRPRDGYHELLIAYHQSFPGDQ